jgi:hypothetical protein
MVVTTKQIMFCLVTSLMIWGLSNDEKRVEEIGIVVAVVHGCLVGGFIAGAEGSEAINMMRMPVPEVLDFRMNLFNGSKNALLIFAVVEETRWRPPCIRPGADDPEHLNLVVIVPLLICSYDPAASFINITPVTLVKYGLERTFGNGDTYR